MSLIFVTSNASKIEIANKFLSPHRIDFTSQGLNIDEVQSEDFKEISIKKAESAFSVLKQPLFISDHSWAITALNGFPGPFMHYINNWLTTDDLLRLMEGKNNREVILHDTICFIDHNGPQFFTADHIGTILTMKQGKALPAQEIISMSDDGVTIAKKLEDDPSVLESSPLYNEFAEWIKLNRPEFILK